MCWSWRRRRSGSSAPSAAAWCHALRAATTWCPLLLLTLSGHRLRHHLRICVAVPDIALHVATHVLRASNRKMDGTGPWQNPVSILRLQTCTFRGCGTRFCYQCGKEYQTTDHFGCCTPLTGAAIPLLPAAGVASPHKPNVFVGDRLRAAASAVLLRLSMHRMTWADDISDSDPSVQGRMRGCQLTTCSHYHGRLTTCSHCHGRLTTRSHCRSRLTAHSRPRDRRADGMANEHSTARVPGWQQQAAQIDLAAAAFCCALLAALLPRTSALSACKPVASGRHLTAAVQQTAPADVQLPAALSPAAIR